jgi:hypothetical protein
MDSLRCYVDVVSIYRSATNPESPHVIWSDTIEIPNIVNGVIVDHPKYEKGTNPSGAILFEFWFLTDRPEWRMVDFERSARRSH